MIKKQETVAVKILGTEYNIACTTTERESLENAAQYLDAQMQAMRQTGRVAGLEKIAVMTALNMAHNLLSSQKDFLSGQVGTRLRALNHRLDEILQ